MGRRAGLIVVAAWLAAAAPARAQDPSVAATPAPTVPPAPALAQQPAPTPTPAPPGAGCAVTSAGLLCPQLPPGCVVTSAGLLCPGGTVAGETAEQPAPEQRRRRRGRVEPATASSPPPAAVPLRRLAFTGFDGIPVAVGGAALLGLGLALRRRVRA